MAEKFSFVKHLTKRDIEKILEKLGFELKYDRHDREGNPLSPISRHTDEDGKSSIIAFCIDKNQIEQENEVAGYLYKESPAFRQFANNLMSLNLAFGGMGGLVNDYMPSHNMMLRFDDFTLTECFSVKSEQEELDFDLKMTNVYQNYMAEKFGRFYYNMKAGYIRSLKMEEAKKSKNENNLEENEKDME